MSSRNTGVTSGLSKYLAVVVKNGNALMRPASTALRSSPVALRVECVV